MNGLWAEGSRPPGAHDEREAARRVRDLFAAIVPRYDLLNHLLSFSWDVIWRRRAAQLACHALPPGAQILDVCCGTGDLAFALERAAATASVAIFAVDFVPAMLDRARRKATRRRSRVSFLAADALQLPFAEASFDLVAVAFGFRNLANYDRGLQEMYRVLRPGGRLAILDFSDELSEPFGTLYRFYFRRVLPWIGGMISGSWQAYRYLPASVGRFPRPTDLAARLAQAGFAAMACHRWTGGAVVLYLAQRPTAPEPPTEMRVREGRRHETSPCSAEVPKRIR